jgi:ABC-type transporter Mla subunit MlaD
MRKNKMWYGVVAVVVVVALVIVGFVVSGNSSPSTSPNSSGTSSDTLTFAEGPGAYPNYIFPYMSCT